MINKEYQNKKEKLIDFVIGFFSVFAAVNLLAFIISLFNVLVALIMANSSEAAVAIYYKIIFVVHWILILALYGWSFVFFYKRRKYVAIGILVEFIIAILLGALLVYGLTQI